MATVTTSSWRLTGVTRELFDASIEARLRDALHGAGYRIINRRQGLPTFLALDVKP